jgi:hypothetical protein
VSTVHSPARDSCPVLPYHSHVRTHGTARQGENRTKERRAARGAPRHCTAPSLESTMMHGGVSVVTEEPPWG